MPSIFLPSRSCTSRRLSSSSTSAVPTHRVMDHGIQRDAAQPVCSGCAMLPVTCGKIANVMDALLAWRRRLRYVHKALPQGVGTGSSLTTMQLLICEYWRSRWSPSVHRLVCTGLAARCGNCCRDGARSSSTQRPGRRQHSPNR